MEIEHIQLQKLTADMGKVFVDADNHTVGTVIYLSPLDDASNYREVTQKEAEEMADSME
jgi:hypothetical protein